MLDASTIIIAWLSLIGSAFTIWFTMFRRGTVRMTQPAFILFGPDSGEGKPKLAVGAHLYTTAQRGAIVEGMFARVTRGNLVPVTQDFDVWVHGKGSLTRGSGIHVGQEGVTGDHHFLLPQGASFEWISGEYTVEILGTIVGRRGLYRFWQLKVTLSHSIHETGDSVFFDWRPALGRYEGHHFGRRERASREAAKLQHLILNGIGVGDIDDQ